jgi:hypothetical protein
LLREDPIARDDLILTDATRPLLSVADIIKVNVLGISREDIAAQYAERKPTDGEPARREDLDP